MPVSAPGVKEKLHSTEEMKIISSEMIFISSVSWRLFSVFRPFKDKFSEKQTEIPLTAI